MMRVEAQSAEIGIALFRGCNIGLDHSVAVHGQSIAE